MARGLVSSRLSTAVKHNPRIPVYWALILACSLISLPEDYKLDKRNPLNQYFVKIGWFWTSSLTLTLLFLTTRLDDRETVARIVFKWFSSTFLWYTSTSFFEYMDKEIGFDISGHTYILIFSNLIISSELKLLDEDGSNITTPGQSQLPTIKTSLLLLSILWDFMLLQTALYYHTMIQKVIAAIWAVGSWYILYVTFYEGSSSTSQNRTIKNRRQKESAASIS